jgi:phage terminase small subunit
MPAWLDGTAAVVWQEYAPQLTELGLLRRLDTESFTAFCLQAAKMRDHPDRMSPADYAQLRIIGEAFGMNPSARSRIVVEQDDGRLKNAAMR